MNYCGRCGTVLPEGSVFCPECGMKLSEALKSESSEQQDLTDKIIKCPNCGADIVSGSTCPLCGYIFKSGAMSKIVQDFSDALQRARSDEERVGLIANFPIPNFKEDILDFLFLASANLTEGASDPVFNAWIVKFDQGCQKAKILVREVEESATLQGLVEGTQARIAEYKRKRVAKKITMTLTENKGIPLALVNSIGTWIAVALCIATLVMINKGIFSGLVQIAAALVIVISSATLLPRKCGCLEYLIALFGAIFAALMWNINSETVVIMLGGGFSIFIVVVEFIYYIAKKIGKGGQ